MLTNISQKNGPNTDAKKIRRILPSRVLLYETGLNSQIISIEQQKKGAIGGSSWRLKHLHERARGKQPSRIANPRRHRVIQLTHFCRRSFDEGQSLGKPV